MFFRETEDEEYRARMAAAVRGYLGEPRWPPADYPGARRDAALAETLATLLSEAREADVSYLPYMPFVDPPEVDSADIDSADVDATDPSETAEDVTATFQWAIEQDAGGVESARDAEQKAEKMSPEEFRALVRRSLKRPRHLFLHQDEESAAEAMRTCGSEWWTAFWKPAIWQRRLTAGRLMERELEDVYRYEVPVGVSEWAMVYYQGTSESGATVGLISARWLRPPSS